MLTIISTVVGLSILILVHELGHFLAAKAVNIQVPRFSLGFGKRLAGFQWGETEFVLSAIPLGGYVKMAGMEDDEAASTLEGAAPPPEDVDPERTFDRKSIPARVLVISAGVIMNLVFAFLVFTGISLVLGETLNPITRVSVPQPAKLQGAAQALRVLPDGATITAVGEKPVHTWQDLVLEMARAPAGPVRLTLQDHPPVSLELSAAQDARGELLGALTPFREAVVADVVGGSPAARAGIRPGDHVVSADGAPVATWGQLVEAIRSHPKKPLALVVERGGQRVPVTVTPKAVRSRDANGNRITIGQIGAAPDVPEIHRRVGVAESVKLGAQQTWDSVVFVGGVVKQLLTGQLSARNMGGLLSIGEASGETASQGLDTWLMFLALFSVNLAVLNLLPIPILDGGHLMFLAFEAVRGRPLSVEARIRLSQVGLVIVVALMIWANGNDVVRLVFGR
ncbi:MAG TPA: RIP metalloprotease RseP [Longimicrobiaceae bacterium]|nr:RIP metalloprotease RseP [Longimicrobiaceae bacterium]